MVRWRRSAGEAVQASDDAVKLVGVARQGRRKRIEVCNGAPKRIGIVGQNAIKSPQRVARRSGHALTGKRVGRQRERLSWSGVGASGLLPPCSVTTGTPVRP